MTSESPLSKDAALEKGRVPQPMRNEPELAQERLSGPDRTAGRVTGNMG